jgi:iron complex transport system ATP-binding protein
MMNFWGTMTRADRSASEHWLDRVGCRPLARRAWAVLSQGERQRVLIARALIAAPQLLILDEPCAGLDPPARHRFLEFLDGLASSTGSPALVLVTHHVEEIVPSVTHALLLKHGRVLAAGPRRRILTSPRLTEAFDAPVKVRCRRGHLSAHLLLSNRRLV